ncbi:hypothetical protein CS022_06775 [Veronia nyctiphanis]|uniref:DUF2956 domain-containing protein n=1 Tax=Veronia nyctiphanis TaxID=1278244 RepID=A0A4Q0YY30_9GAMM|nr:DUF2956 domain-containing protein [Veronia nyctiphanis]RXJ73971.1 hypothetical protein CS022_06775 [Veronia nyctiphanis]
MAAPAASKETQEEAMKIASSTKKPGQTKEQTRLIAQGIEKGIALYKKQQKAKARERDKEKKKQARLKISENEAVKHEEPMTDDINTGKASSHIIPWILLGLSWVGFGLYFFLAK